MHVYGGWPDADFDDVEDAAYFIGDWLSRWVRMPVSQYKEKWGTARVYCSFGWSSFYSIRRPQYTWVPSWYPWGFDLWMSYKTPIFSLINRLIIPIHKAAYRYRYKAAIKKWPHLREEILNGADWRELLRGL